jgi:Flp pilus assembly protein TadD
MCCVRAWLVLGAAAFFATGCVTLETGARRAQTLTPSPPASTESRQAFDRALTAIKTGKMQEAEVALRGIARREPQLSGAHANLGLVYLRQGRSKEAVGALNRAIELNPQRAAYHNELGIAYRQEGRFDEARRSYQRALELDPNYAKAHLNLGILYDLYLNDPERALSQYRRYQVLVPSGDQVVTKWIVDLEQRQRGGRSDKRKENG